MAQLSTALFERFREGNSLVPCLRSVSSFARTSVGGARVCFGVGLSGERIRKFLPFSRERFF